MINRFFVSALCLPFLAGCASTKKGHTLELLQCQSRIVSLEQKLKEKDSELAQLEQDLQNIEDRSYQRSTAPIKMRTDSDYSANPSTSQIQKALKIAGFYKGSIDGKMGSKTEGAIIKFQRKNGLKADGKVGPMTWAELKPYL